MSTYELGAGYILIAVLVVLAVSYGWFQLVHLRQLARDADPSSPEWRYRRNQARRRLLNSVLMLLLAALLAGALIYLHAPIERLVNMHDQAEAEGATRVPTDEERSFFRFYSAYWIVVLLVLLLIVTIALLDLLATRRFATGEHRKIREERREMIARQAARLRHERNGHG